MEKITKFITQMKIVLLFITGLEVLVLHDITASFFLWCGYGIYKLIND